MRDRIEWLVIAFAVGCGCAEKPTPPPSVTARAPGELSPACLSATVGLPPECAASLGVACANVEGSRDEAGRPWLAVDYACLAGAKSCVEARACGVRDVRP